MAYAALVSVEQSLKQAAMLHLSVAHDIRKQSPFLLPKIEYLIKCLEDSSHKTTDQKASSLITRIRDASYRAQYLVDLYCYDTEMEIIRQVPVPKNVDLWDIFRVIDDIESDIKELTGSATEVIESRLVLKNDLQLPNPGSEDEMVGFKDLRVQITEELTGTQSSLTVVSITGMGGIGKTTLARYIYYAPYVGYHFDCRAWVVVSQSFSIRNFLLGILGFMKVLSDEMFIEGEYELGLRLYDTLKGRRYLITIDDIWDTSVWDEIRRWFPNDNNGSRILLTTRLASVAAYASFSGGHIHHVSVLSSEDSWSLLRAKAFGDKDCPPELQQIGHKISERCGRLPLSLVVTGGLLSQITKTKDVWLNFEKYEDEEISVSKLIKLWVAEGFLKQVEHQDPEAVAEKCLMELVDQNMIIIPKHNFQGKVKTCRMHNLLHNLCVREADKDKFLCVMGTPRYEITPHNQYFRLSIHSRTLPHLIFPDSSIPSFSHVRSLLCTDHHLSPSVFLKFKLLRVVDAIKVAFPKFPNELLELLNLRYISLTCPKNIPASISNLRNLQTLVIRHEDGVNLPLEIWNMTHLRHVEFEVGYVPCPIVGTSPLVLENLRTLSGLRNLRFTHDVSARIPWIERLKVYYDTDLDEEKGWSYYEFHNLVNLQRLRALKIYIYPWPIDLKLEFQFPPSLQVLSLGGCSLSWEDVSVVGRLPILQVLKLRRGSFLGKHWRANEGEFCQLKLLLLESLDLVLWEIYNDRYEFPCLEQLIVRNCRMLKKIPHEMGEIPALTKIEVDYCNESVLASAKEIRDMQLEMGKEDFQLVLGTSSYFNSPIYSKNPFAASSWKRKFTDGEKEEEEEDKTDFSLKPASKSPDTLQPAVSNIETGNAEHSENFDFISGTEQQKIPNRSLDSMETVGPWRFAWNPKSCMVGLHEYFLQIQDWIFGANDTNIHLEVMSIAGMAGIGKTTFARYLFEYPTLDENFDINVWVSVSRTNDVRKIIKDILESVRPMQVELDGKSIAQLADILRKSLKDKTYLIVLDDVWDIQLWDDIQTSFPDDNIWSRIILTTRLSEMDLKVRFFKIHHMSLLTPEMSWTLFCMKAFGKEECPQELKYAAENILSNCGGLPLAIVVIGGLLSKVSRTEDVWQLIARTMNSTIMSEEQLKGILYFAYNYLPLHLKACFRSMIIFVGDGELSIPKLVGHWIDEGLVGQLGSKSPQEVAEEFLKDLMDRSLVVVCKRNKKGEAETCGIPRVWQDYFMVEDPDSFEILLSKSNQSTKPKEGMADLPRSYGEGTSMIVEKGQKAKINHKKSLEISMYTLFNNRYTKDCIRYCSIFPTTYEFTKDILVWLWIAHGGTIAGNSIFIEEVCIQCFDILLKQQYIVPTGYDPCGDEMKYKVGDEMNAFLQNHLQGSRFSKELDGKHMEESKLEHLSLSFKEIDQINVQIIKRFSRLQTLIIHRCYGFNIKQLPLDLFSELKELRILSLSHTDVMELPSSIKSSKELRYLDMSETPIRWLPESMCNLFHLQTLKLDNCLGIMELPQRTKEWTNLRHLMLDVARQLQFMPERIGKLSELRTLRAFLVGEEDGYTINELKNMNKLSGSLRILKLENIKTPEQAADASLCWKQGLKKIELQWSDLQDEMNPIEEEILTYLGPPLGIQELKILYFSGGNLPSWIGMPSFSEMVSLTLHKCRYCSNLPSLGLLPSLKHLSIIGMNEVLEINSLFCGEQGNDQNQPSFPALQNLSFCSMSKLEKWTEMRTGDFPRLMNLTIESCPKINCLPSLTHLISLINMVISYCPELSCLPDGMLPSKLESLMIKNCPKLKGRCSDDGGEDWPKIAHVPVFYIDGVKIHTK
ncbi:uncharacterized protein [Henckelia pumila]|uniref:uncharacterized protein isoform X2 n=1 Tax=Henckelia pumila TaxID=405737 RepID=UPI003C6E9814